MFTLMFFIALLVFLSIEEYTMTVFGFPYETYLIIDFFQESIRVSSTFRYVVILAMFIFAVGMLDEVMRAYLRLKKSAEHKRKHEDVWENKKENKK